MHIFPTPLMTLLCTRGQQDLLIIRHKEGFWFTLTCIFSVRPEPTEKSNCEPQLMGGTECSTFQEIKTVLSAVLPYLILLNISLTTCLSGSEQAPCFVSRDGRQDLLSVNLERKNWCMSNQIINKLAETPVNWNHLPKSRWIGNHCVHKRDDLDIANWDLVLVTQAQQAFENLIIERSNDRRIRPRRTYNKHACVTMLAPLGVTEVHYVRPDCVGTPCHWKHFEVGLGELLLWINIEWCDPRKHLCDLCASDSRPLKWLTQHNYLLDTKLDQASNLTKHRGCWFGHVGIPVLPSSERVIYSERNYCDCSVKASHSELS